MTEQCRERKLATLDRTVMEAVRYFRSVDERLTDGNQTARDVLSHLVFWHREYVCVARALGEQRQPALRSGTFAELNRQASWEFRYYSMRELAEKLECLQEQLVAALCALPDWTVNFPVKEGGRTWSVEERVPTIESHIRNHVSRLKKAVRQAEEAARAVS